MRIFRRPDQAVHLLGKHDRSLESGAMATRVQPRTGCHGVGELVWFDEHPPPNHQGIVANCPKVVWNAPPNKL